MTQKTTLEDFPKFTLTRLSRGKIDLDGFTEFELEGEFNRAIERVGEITWFWLLVGDRHAVCAQWRTLDEGTRAATLVVRERKLPAMEGKALYYLSPVWNAEHIWMVLDEQWGWKQVRFQAVDAIAETYEANEASLVDGREIRTWTKLRRADKHTFTERYAPAAEQVPPSGREQVIPGGWNHEHCQLCRGHIDHGDLGYRDRAEQWICESCYERYVKTRDLSFVG
jgi:hypothetical protein